MAFDLDKVIAEHSESAKKRKPFPFKFEGDTYTLPGELDVIALRAAAQTDLLTAFRRLLGEDQYAKIVASPTLLHPEVLNTIMNAYYQHIAGLAAGESSASSTSSRSTARPSKRTSKRTTTSRSRR